MSYLVKRSLRLLIGPNSEPIRTSLALEPEYWEALEASAKGARQSVPAWVAAVEKMRASAFPNQSLASAVRVQLLADASARARA